MRALKRFLYEFIPLVLNGSNAARLARDFGPGWDWVPGDCAGRALNLRIVGSLSS